MPVKNIGPLFRLHKENISKQRGISLEERITADDLDKIANRAALLTLLDVFIEEHRVKYSSRYSPLRGRDALTHLILTKYSWPVEEIQKMTIANSIIAIQYLFQEEQLSEISKGFLGKINEHYYHLVFEDFPDSDWNPVLHEEYLSLKD